MSTKDFGSRASRKFDFGDLFGCLLRTLLPLSYCPVAAATCRFTVQGPESVGDADNGQNWGRWIRTRLQTNGQEPGVGNKWQLGRGREASADSEAAADSILNCFGLTVKKLYEAFGQPDEGVIYSVDLFTVVSQLRPDLMRETDPQRIRMLGLAGRVETCVV